MDDAKQVDIPEVAHPAGEAWRDERGRQPDPVAEHEGPVGGIAAPDAQPSRTQAQCVERRPDFGVVPQRFDVRSVGGIRVGGSLGPIGKPARAPVPEGIVRRIPRALHAAVRHPRSRHLRRQPLPQRVVHCALPAAVEVGCGLRQFGRADGRVDRDRGQPRRGQRLLHSVRRHRVDERGRVSRKQRTVEREPGRRVHRRGHRPGVADGHGGVCDGVYEGGVGDLGLEGSREIGGPLHHGLELRVQHDRDMTLRFRGGHRPRPAAPEALHEGVGGLDVPPPVLAAVPPHHGQRRRLRLGDPVAAGQQPRPAGAVEYPVRLHLDALPAALHDLDPPPLPVGARFRQPRHARYDLRPGLHRRLTQDVVEPRPQDVEPGGAPREVVAAAFTAPKRRVPAVRQESARLHHPQQPRCGQHLARAGRQRFGQRRRGRVGVRRSLDDHGLQAPLREEARGGGAGRTAAEDEDLGVGVHSQQSQRSARAGQGGLPGIRAIRDEGVRHRAPRRILGGIRIRHSLRRNGEATRAEDAWQTD